MNWEDRHPWENQVLMEAAGNALWLSEERLRPSMLLQPRLSIDGNKWCALYGENLVEGVAGFGDSPAEAYTDFDSNWNEKLPKTQGRPCNETNPSRERDPSNL